jgi:hypothetical protein
MLAIISLITVSIAAPAYTSSAPVVPATYPASIAQVTEVIAPLSLAASYPAIPKAVAPVAVAAVETPTPTAEVVAPVVAVDATTTPCVETPTPTTEVVAPVVAVILTTTPCEVTPIPTTEVVAPVDDVKSYPAETPAPEAVAPVVVDKVVTQTPTYATVNPLVTEGVNLILLNSSVSNSMSAIALLAMAVSMF